MPRISIFLKEIDATIEFAVDGKGTVRQLTLLQDNQYSRALRIEPSASPASPDQVEKSPASNSPEGPAGDPAASPRAKP